LLATPPASAFGQSLTRMVTQPKDPPAATSRKLSSRRSQTHRHRFSEGHCYTNATCENRNSRQRPPAGPHSSTQRSRAIKPKGSTAPGFRTHQRTAQLAHTILQADKLAHVRSSHHQQEAGTPLLSQRTQGDSALRSGQNKARMRGRATRDRIKFKLRTRATISQKSGCRTNQCKAVAHTNGACPNSFDACASDFP